MSKARMLLWAAIAVVGMISAGTVAAESSTLTLFVYQGEPRYPLKGASILLISRGGTKSLGATDQRGEYRALKADLREKQGIALLVCFQDSNTDCSAVRLEDGEVLAFDELSINVPLPRAVDRFKVNPRR